jgi:hypothetical protein
MAPRLIAPMGSLRINLGSVNGRRSSFSCANLADRAARPHSVRLLALGCRGRTSDPPRPRAPGPGFGAHDEHPHPQCSSGAPLFVLGYLCFLVSFHERIEQGLSFLAEDSCQEEAVDPSMRGSSGRTAWAGGRRAGVPHREDSRIVEAGDLALMASDWHYTARPSPVSWWSGQAPRWRWRDANLKAPGAR